MKCPRCKEDSVTLLTQAPKEDAWKVYRCTTCFYSYRDTEPQNRTNPDMYEPRFCIDPKKINLLDQIPPVPPLLKSQTH